MKLLKILLVVVMATVVSMPLVAKDKTITIAVIDSGIDASIPKLCKFGHKSFSSALPNPLLDEDGHGTHIAGLISSTAEDGDYCLVSIKYYNVKAKGTENLDNMIKSVQYAINIGVNFINISGGGPERNEQEYKLIETALNQHIKIVVAAGNEHIDLDKVCNFFPACYDKRIVIVGNLIRNGSTTRSPTSNYGNVVNRWETGTYVLSTAPGGKLVRMSGTSQATAVATGKLVREALKK